MFVLNFLLGGKHKKAGVVTLKGWTYDVNKLFSEQIPAQIEALTYTVTYLEYHGKTLNKGGTAGEA